MKFFIRLLIQILMWPVGLIFSEKVSWFFLLLGGQLYAGIIRPRFKKASTLHTFGYPIYLQGGKFIELGDHVTLGKECRLEAHEKWLGQKFTPKLVIDEHVVINQHCHIGCINYVHIGKYTTIAQRALIIDHHHGDTVYKHLVLPPRHRPLYHKGAVDIGDYVSIGENCVILPGVTIGHNSVIGANAVVTKDIPPFSIVGGNPAKVIKTIQPC